MTRRAAFYLFRNYEFKKKDTEKVRPRDQFFILKDTLFDEVRSECYLNNYFSNTILGMLMSKVFEIKDRHFKQKTVQYIQNGRVSVDGREKECHVHLSKKVD